MKAQDLRIGNWVLCEPNNASIERTIDYEDFRLAHFDSERFEPIPLTEEWLERFGFEKDEEYDEGGLVDYRMTLMKNSLEFVSFWNSEDLTGVNQPQTGVDVEYVHQLQNLFYCLCGEELELNP